jgi:hypothetical protein
MAELISLAERRERRAAEEHARALVIFECAAALARQNHAGLLDLIQLAYGPQWVEERVRETLAPVHHTDAPRHAASVRTPVP